MKLNLQKRIQVINIVLLVLIVVMSYWLYESLIGPWRVVQEQERMTELTRERMSIIRNVLQQYNKQHGNFPPSDKLEIIVKYIEGNDQVKKSISINGDDFAILLKSPRPPYHPFVYKANNESSPPLYLLKDPDSDDLIGGLEKTNSLNSASWEE